ncbi:Hydrophobin-3 [Leucoagaricus sp. SymC.cos]|nr:Hydrophobin-3 [Leucoagaricus sp. SymC.cos]
MFARAISVLFFLFFTIPLMVSATAVPRGHPNHGGGKSSTTVVNTNQCNVGSVNCCNSVQSASSTNFGDLFGPLSSLIGPISGNIGFTCSPTTVGGTSGNSCSAQTVCCENNHFNGLIAIGCSPININT